MPSIQIELAIEAPPAVRVIAQNESEERRLMDWIRSHDHFAELLLRALELADEEHAA